MSRIKSQMGSQVWLEEVHGDYAGFRYRIENVLFSGRSEFQKIDVVETSGFGRMLLNDGLVMVTERDEHVYHEMISHVPMFTHPHPKRVLIIGGGDGGTAREVLRHSSVESVVMVEIDKMVTDVCRDYIPQTTSALEDPRLDLRFEDGVKFVKETRKSFDVALVDSTDPIGPAGPLFNIEFYQDLSRCLADDGIVVSQAGSAHYEAEAQADVIQLVSQLFPVCRLYNYNNLTYPGAGWAFGFGSKKYHPIKDFSPTRVAESGLTFQYYNPDMQVASFAQPNFVLERLGDLFRDG